MKITEHYDEAAKNAPWCIALGSFDGVHLGHKKLIEILREEAVSAGTQSMVYTFHTHPRKILIPDRHIYLITDNKKRSEIIEQLGVDMLYLEDFNNIRDMGAEDFVKNILVDRFSVKSVVIGYNYRFGAKGAGNAAVLKEYGDKYGFRVIIVDAYEVNGHAVSSSLIRHIIRSGSVDKVSEYLGRDFSVHGKVVYGKQNGEVMGFKTANINVKKDITLPKKGVYHTSTKVLGRLYKSITNIGFNPTFNGESLSVETHLLDFCDDIYGEEIEIFFHKYKRDEIKFKNVEELVKQINSDIRDRLEYEPLE
ncbi:MAG: bifunctional riboflavin kinase/FAD synthetase [Gracilibacteraceae bacterium]|nr:bifunctional riboflavin kinase/FAD synthetase [Gracilibacteraceae bacterium]